jgi:Mrp family chromosome partitioning ATPase
MNGQTEITGRLLEKAAKLTEQADRLRAKATALRTAVEVLREDDEHILLSNKDLQGVTMKQAVTAVLSDAGKPLHTREIHAAVAKRGRLIDMDALRGLLYGIEGQKAFSRVGKAIWELKEQNKSAE